MNAESIPARYMATLSRLLIEECCNADRQEMHEHPEHAHDLRYAAGLNHPRWKEFIELANANHVVVRLLSILQRAARTEGNLEFATKCETLLDKERSRIEHAIYSLHTVCKVLESHGCPVVVIKSLDHWPDLGSDFDLYTTADHQDVQEVMRRECNAHQVTRSWGDRLANKWNFEVPGLRELVEIHVKFLGQTGEHENIAKRIVGRRTTRVVEGHLFHVPAAEERLVISALQRVYRHFYFRLCDVVDTALLLRKEAVDFEELKRATTQAGIWSGVATFLCLIRNYIEYYGGSMALPRVVVRSAEGFGADMRFKRQFLRLSRLTAANLYCTQLLQAGLHGDLRALVRLPLLPPLATSALLAYRLTGNDKGVW